MMMMTTRWRWRRKRWSAMFLHLHHNLEAPTPETQTQREREESEEEEMEGKKKSSEILHLQLFSSFLPVRPFTHLSVNVGHFSSQNHAADFTFHLHALERRPLGLGELHGLRNGPLLLQVHLQDNNKSEEDTENVLEKLASDWLGSTPPRRCSPGRAG